MVITMQWFDKLRPAQPGLLALRLLVAAFGIAMTCVAVSMFYLMELGSDPYQVLCVALHGQLGISHGAANTLANGTIILFMLLFKRRYLNISVFLSLIISGPLVDFFNALLAPVVNTSLPLGVRLALIPVGCALMGAGIFVYTAPALGASPGDSLGIIIADALHRPYSLVRIGMDAAYTLAGFLLGGPVGATTLAAVLLTGPCMGLTKKLLGNQPFFTRLAPAAPGIS